PCEGDRLAMVPGRRSDQAAVELVPRRLRDEVHAASNLEGAGRQVVLVLDVNLRADELAQAGVREERRRTEVWSDDAAGGLDIGERGSRHLATEPRYGWRGGG